jgi:hypothetical protein
MTAARFFLILWLISSMSEWAATQSYPWSMTCLLTRTRNATFWLTRLFLSMCLLEGIALRRQSSRTQSIRAVRTFLRLFLYQGVRLAFIANISLILFVQKHSATIRTLILNWFLSMTWMWTSNSSSYPWLIARYGLWIAHFLIRWKIQGTVTHKYNVRKFTAEYGNGEVFVFDVSDGTNEISVASFNLQSQEFQSRIELAQVHVPPIRVSLGKWSRGSWIDLILEKACDLTVDHAEDRWEVSTILIEFRHLSWRLD